MTNQTTQQTIRQDGAAVLARHWAGREALDHFNARSLEEAIAVLQHYGPKARLIAGGTDTIGLMKLGVKKPGALVDLKTVPGLSGITETPQGLRIGALTSIRDLERSPVVRSAYPALAAAAHAVASPIIRNMATIAGNLCQEVRCWYYRHSPDTGISFVCRRKGGAECYARDGENKYHAIIGYGDCCAVSPSDLAPVLMTLDAELEVVGPKGKRGMAVEQLYAPMGLTLGHAEIIASIVVPAPPPGLRQRFEKSRIRKAIDFALASAAVAAAIEGGLVTHARVVLGGVAPMPYRSRAAEEAIIGKPLSEEAAEACAEAALRHAAPLSQNGYKVPLAKALVKRALGR